MQAAGNRADNAPRQGATDGPGTEDMAIVEEALGMRDVVECISRHVGEEDLLAWKLSCRGFLAGAVACGRAEEKSPAGSLVCSKARVLWGLGAGLPLRADQVIEWACEAGCVDVVAWARGRRFPVVDHACWAAAARGGQVEVMEYLLEAGVYWETENIPTKYIHREVHLLEDLGVLGTCASAARHGRLAALQYAREQGIPWDVSTLMAASGGGHEAVVRWAVEQGCPVDEFGSNLCALAAESGNLGCLQWMCRQGWEMDGYTLEAAAKAGALDVLRFAREQGVEWMDPDPEGFPGMRAALRGPEEVLRWMVEEGGYEWLGDECIVAARGGHKGLLQWLRERGCEWHTTCEEAARSGNLELLMWARGEGAPWDASVCAAAADEGHIECLKWCRANGCEWDHWTLDHAAKGGHVECLAWALDNSCPLDDPARLAWIAACYDRSGQALRLCHARGIAWDYQVCAKLIEAGDLPLLRWARAQGAPWPSDPDNWRKMLGRPWPKHVVHWAVAQGLEVGGF